MMGSQINSRTGEPHLSHFKDASVKCTDGKIYTHDGNSIFYKMKHNFENNFHKIQGRMKMKKNLESHYRNRNVQTNNLYICRTAENQEIITCNAENMEEKSMNTLNYIEDLMLEQHIQHHKSELRATREHVENYIQVSQQCSKNDQINTANRREPTIIECFSVKNMSVFLDNKEQICELLHSTMAEVLHKQRKCDKLEMSEGHNVKLNAITSCLTNLKTVITSETPGKIKRNEPLDILHCIFKKWNIVMFVTCEYLIVEKLSGFLFSKGLNTGQIEKLRGNLGIFLVEL